MKKAISLVLALLFLLTALPMGAIPVAAEEVYAEDGSVIVNVKDFGAVGDGKTDDRQAILEAFYFAMVEYMNHDIPVTVYFPEGQYGLLYGGLYIYMPRGFGNLTVKGDGADKSTLVYLDEWDNNGSWVALRILPKITPESEEQYLHDITVQDLGVYDTDPAKHAWHTDKGDPSTEETHGFNIQYCVRATIRNCLTTDVGDECFDMSHCIDSVMTENLVVKNRITGKGGGSFSVGDGSKNVVVNNNAVVFNADDPSDSHFGFAVEALAEHIQDVYITDNTVQNINGWGVNIGLPGGTADNVLVQNNTFTDCHQGGIRFTGTGLGTNVKILDNYIANTRFGVCVDGANKAGVLVDGCLIDTVTSYGVSVNSPKHSDTVVRNTVIRNARWRALYNAGTNTLFDRVLVDGSGTAGGVTDSAVIQYANGGDCTISNSAFFNCQNKRALQGVSKVINTYVQQPEISGYSSITGATLIRNCWVNRMVTIKSGGVVDGLTVHATADLGTHAINLSGVIGCTIKNCRFVLPSRYAVNETGGSNNNNFINNVCVGGSGIKVTGSNTMATGNVRATLSANEQLQYYLLDGCATIVAPVDPTATEAAIPATLEDCPVTAIDPWAFALCDALTSVSLPDSLSTVGNFSFAYCDGLDRVFYGGLESQRSAVVVGESNTALADALWTYHWENHTYDHACDPDCNDCDFVREVGEHVFDGICDPDCNACGEVREAPDHTYEAVVTAPTCTANGYTTHTCSVCGDSYVTDETAAVDHAYDHACDPACNLCGGLREVPDHVYDDDRDADCNECGFERVVIIPGDADGDGRVNNRDLGLIQRYLNGIDVSDKNFEVLAADLNADGKVNNRDLALLQRQLNS